jgi:hypothetical protein
LHNENSHKFKVCKSVHHRTIKINHQPHARSFHFITLTFIYSSTCFGRFPVHHQELGDCSVSLWFYRRIVVIAVLTFIYSSTCFGRSPAHHQELNDCSNSLWLYLRIVVIAVHSMAITTIRR